MLTQSFGAVPRAQSRMWKMAALAAEAAEDAPRALMMAAPRCCTSGMKVPRYQSTSTLGSAASPLMSALEMSGYWVEEWLPQMVTFVMSLMVVPVFCASWVRAR